MQTAIIPARGDSKSIPKKNIYSLQGHPLIAYSIASCKLCKNIDRIIVSTDNEEIAEVSKKYGAEVPFIRPAKYATDLSSDLDYLGHFFSLIDVAEVVLVRPTTPLRDPSCMSKAIEAYDIHKGDLTGFRSAEEHNHPVHKMFQIENGFFSGFFDNYYGVKDYTNLPRQIFPKTFVPNGYVDIVKRETVDGRSSFGDKVFPWVTESICDIDTLADIEFLEYKISKGSILLDYLNNNRFFERLSCVIV